MRYTITKMKQPVHSSFMKEGRIFYRVKGNGVYLRDFTSKRKAEMYIANYKQHKSKRLTLAQIKAMSTDYFFSRNTMRFFKGARYSTRFDRKTGKNYVKVNHRGRTIWYLFNIISGKLNIVAKEKVPF